jgi:hypothetical protein
MVSLYRVTYVPGVSVTYVPGSDRYVLWVTQKLGGATRLLTEMNVTLD